VRERDEKQRLHGSLAQARFLGQPAVGEQDDEQAAEQQGDQPCGAHEQVVDQRAALGHARLERGAELRGLRVDRADQLLQFDSGTRDAVGRLRVLGDVERPAGRRAGAGRRLERPTSASIERTAPSTEVAVRLPASSAARSSTSIGSRIACWLASSSESCRISASRSFENSSGSASATAAKRSADVLIMKKLMWLFRAGVPMAAQADYLDVIGFKMNPGCTMGKYQQIVQDFRNQWANARGDKVEILVPAQSSEVGMYYWVGAFPMRKRSARGSTRGCRHSPTRIRARRC